MQTTGTNTLTAATHVGPIIVEVGESMEYVQAAREALAGAAELCKVQWEYESPNLEYLIEQALKRAEEYLLTTGKLISQANPGENLQSVLTRLHEKFDSIGGYRLGQLYARILLTKQMSLVAALNQQLQDALASEQPDAEICQAILTALEHEHARQALAANMWVAALTYMEEAYRHYNTAQKLAAMHVEKPAPESAS